MLRRHAVWRYLIQKFPYLFLSSLFLPGMVAICILAPQYAFSAQATLTWNAPTTNIDGTPLTDIAGYKIYYGTASGNYSQTVDVGNLTNSGVSNLSDGTTYYFAVTAYDTSGNGSGYSNEVSKTTPAGQQYSVLIAKSGTGSGTVTSSAGGINCGSSCTATYNSGSVVTLTATPAGGSTFTGWSGGGCTGTGTCSLSMSGNVTVTATFAVNTTYSITATAGTGGTISPSGLLAVSGGTGKTFTIAPNTGYTISGVKVDGVSVGAVTTYTFSNVTANHTIAATFTYVVPTAPTVTSISPLAGSTAGGTAVQITGTGFISGSTVKIGAANATGVVVNSATSISAVTPAGTTGLADIVVTNTNGTGKLTGGFTYVVSAPTTITFDNPVPSGSSGSYLNSLFQGINFGTNQWRWETAWLVDSTRHIYFASSSGTSRTFTFSPAPRFLISMRVFTGQNGTLTLTDNLGQTITQAVTKGSMQTVTTGWTQASTTITVQFTAGWELAVDDITFRAP